MFNNKQYNKTLLFMEINFKFSNNKCCIFTIHDTGFLTEKRIKGNFILIIYILCTNMLENGKLFELDYNFKSGV